VAILAALAAAAFVFRGCDRRLHLTRDETTAVIAPASAPEPTSAQSARKGQIYFHRDLALSKVYPGEGLVTHFPEMAERGLNGYQIQSDRLSPDAMRIAFGKAVIRPINGGFGSFPPDNIYVRRITTSEPAEQIVALEGVEIHEFFWSPDGAKIAISSWDEKHGIRNWVVDATTRKVQEINLPRYHLADGKDYALAIAAWSPDGNWFVASDEGFLYLAQIDKTKPVWSWSGRKRLTKEPRSILGGTCAFAPDGRRVLFVALEEGVRMTLRTVDVEGNEERTLVSPGKFTDLFACWSPDSRRVAYSGAHLDSSGKRAGRSGIYVVEADGSSAEPAPVMEEMHPPELTRLRVVDWR
jgi:Tol biopolymer transport system component